MTVPGNVPAPESITENSSTVPTRHPDSGTDSKSSLFFLQVPSDNVDITEKEKISTKTNTETAAYQYTLL